MRVAGAQGRIPDASAKAPEGECEEGNRSAEAVLQHRFRDREFVLEFTVGGGGEVHMGHAVRADDDAAPVELSAIISHVMRPGALTKSTGMKDMKPGTRPASMLSPIDNRSQIEIRRRR